MAFRLKTWFFQNAGSTSVRGNFTRLAQGHDPSQATFQDLLDTTALKTEQGDSAQVDNGNPISDTNAIQGLVVLATDVQAKAGQAQFTNRKIVAQPHQLPTVESLQNDFTISTVPADGTVSATQNIFEITAEVGTTTRNRYQVRFQTAFIKFLLARLLPSGGTNGQILGKASNTDFNFTWLSAATFPTQTGNAGRFLQTNGTSVSWADIPQADAGTSNPSFEVRVGSTNSRVRIVSPASGGNFTADITTANLAAARVHTLPDKSGTIAHLSDIVTPTLVVKARTSDQIINVNSTFNNTSLSVDIPSGETWLLKYKIAFSAISGSGQQNSTLFNITGTFTTIRTLFFGNNTTGVGINSLFINGSASITGWGPSTATSSGIYYMDIELVVTNTSGSTQTLTPTHQNASGSSANLTLTFSSVIASKLS